ncbi:MAG: S8 family serine peptidase [Flavobacteriales bacterium]|nr:S8 family serine peptidase [Flavobacteriales bacterium]
MQLDSNLFESGYSDLALQSTYVGVLDALPLYRTLSGCELRLGFQIVLDFLETTTELEIQDIENQFGLELIDNPGWARLYSCADPIQSAKSINLSGKVKYCDPNFFIPYEFSSYIPNDEYFSRQWHLNNLPGTVFNDGAAGIAGSDINAPEAWELTTGSPDVLVAIFDEGLELNHPDIPEARVLRTNSDNGTTTLPELSNHGNAVAGIIGAEMDNKIGVVGIAPNCRLNIFPVTSLDYTSLNTISGEFVFGIMGLYFRALGNGVRIFNHSGFFFSTAGIQSEIADAVSAGLLIVRAAGNLSSHIDGLNQEIGDPAFAQIANTIIVGASDKSDFQADYSPTSQYIDICAPSATDYQGYSGSNGVSGSPIGFSPISGEERNIWTIDQTGASPDELVYDWNPTNVTDPSSPLVTSGNIPQLSDCSNALDYTGRFWGTSAATPQVAATAALMLSANSCLTVPELFDILTGTADKVHEDNYDYHWNAEADGHSKELGFGRLNSFAAVQEAINLGHIFMTVTVTDFAIGSSDDAEYILNIQLNPGETLSDYHVYIRQTNHYESGLPEMIEVPLTENPLTIHLDAPVLHTHLLTVTNDNFLSIYDQSPARRTTQVFIDQTPPQLDFLTLVPATCSGDSDGELIAEIACPIDQNYDWMIDGEVLSYGVTFFHATDLSSGLHHLTVLNNEQIVVDTDINIGPDPILFEVSKTEVSCHGSSDGQICLNVTGGTMPYIFDWNFSSDNSNCVGELNAGLYEVIINDQNGCSNLATIPISQPDPILFSLNGDFMADCNEVCNAHIDVTASGGVGVIDIIWPEGINPNSLCGDQTYELICIDESGCSVPITISTTLEEYSCCFVEDLITNQAQCYLPNAAISFATGNLPIGTTITWSTSDGQTSTDIEPDFTFQQSGIYEIEFIPNTPVCGLVAPVSTQLEIGAYDDDGMDLNFLNGFDAQLFADAISNESFNCGQDIIIGDGVTQMEVYFVGTHFNFGPGVKIIINENAEVFFENCEFTACKNWSGFELKSDGSTAELPAALVLNNCLIEYALVGIYTTDISHESEVREAGIYHIEDCDFINNLVSIRVESANAPNHELSYEQRNGSFYSRFKLNDEFEGRFDEPFRSMVDYYYTKSYHFFSCEFENGISNVEEWSDRGVAIHGFNASFYIDDEDTENADAELSRFKGFDMAIELSVTDGTYNHPIIRETDFAQNRIAIYNLNVCFQRIIKNDIIVGEPTGIAALDEEEIDHEGMVLDGGGFYRVSSNEIIGDALSTSNTGATIGIRIRDNVTQSQEVNNNEVHNCNYALLANGNNRINDSGLRYVCNQMSDNGTDIFVGEFPSSGFAADISKWQSDLGDPFFNDNDEKAAGNTFTANPVEQNFFNNENGMDISYFYYSSESNQLPVINSNGQISLVQTTDQSNVCALEYIDQYPTASVGDSILSDLTAKIDALNLDFLSYQYLYHAIIDNGNTAAMVELIENAWSEDIWETRTNLLDGSPYLSDEALRKVADATPEFPYLFALEIFLANPTVTTQSAFLLYLKTTTDMPDAMIDLVADNTSQAMLRSELEENLTKTHMRLIDALSFKIHYSVDMDSTNSYEMSKDLADMESILGNWILVDQLVNQKRLEEAKDLVLTTRNHIYFTKLDIRDEAESMNMWLEILESNSDLENLSGNDLNDMQYLQSQFYFTTAGKKAAAVLNEYFLEGHFTPAYYHQNISSPRSIQLNLNGMAEVSFITLFPNPAQDFVQVSLQLPSNNNKGAILTLRDINGKTIQRFEENQLSNLILIDTRSLNSGQYVLSLIVNDQEIESQRLQIIR